MRVGVVVQSRFASTRFPGKAMVDVAGKPLLAHLLDRLSGVRLADVLVLACTDEQADEPLALLAGGRGWSVHRGRTGLVLDQFVDICKLFGLDAVVRVTGDCPLLDPATVDMLVARYLMGDVVHVEPLGLPDGTWCEVVESSALFRMHSDPRLRPEEREHVTLRARRHPEAYALGFVDLRLGRDNERVVVDEPADLVLVGRLLEALPEGFTYGDVQRLLARNPAWRTLNSGVVPSVVEGLYRERVIA